jgi:hypothetical protein
LFRFKFTKVRNGFSGGERVTYFKCTEPFCHVKCRTLLLDLHNPPAGPIEFKQVKTKR